MSAAVFAEGRDVVAFARGTGRFAYIWAQDGFAFATDGSRMAFVPIDSAARHCWDEDGVEIVDGLAPRMPAWQTLARRADEARMFIWNFDCRVLRAALKSAVTAHLAYCRETRAENARARAPLSAELTRATHAGEKAVAAKMRRELDEIRDPDPVADARFEGLRGGLVLRAGQIVMPMEYSYTAGAGAHVCVAAAYVLDALRGRRGRASIQGGDARDAIVVRGGGCARVDLINPRAAK